jgi:caffeoyl-CoA O-methyltransferase
MKSITTWAVAAGLLLTVACDAYAQRGSRPGASDDWRQANIPYDNRWLPKDDQEAGFMEALSRMRQGPRYANVPTTDGRLLRLLTETINAQRVVEIGMSTGESALWFAIALRATGGTLITHEINPRMIEIARRNFEMAGIDDIITIIEGDAHETVLQHTEPIDILFLDADKEGYIDYLNKLLPLVRPGGLIIAHNMDQRSAHPPFVEAITQNPELETTFLMMQGSGVSVTMKKR